MRLHRFYIPPHTVQLKHDFWVHDLALIRQWRSVLRLREGQQVVLFDGVESERLYDIKELKEKEAHLVLVTDFERQLPTKEVYLFFSLLKKDKNDWVLQKATELGVSHFVPLLADRSEKTGFNSERAEKIVIEAAEQCGRSDIPRVREPMLIRTAIEHMGDKLPLIICQMGGARPTELAKSSFGLLIGPEGGWSDDELALFSEHKLPELGLGDFTLRAETAAVTAVAKALHA